MSDSIPRPRRFGLRIIAGSLSPARLAHLARTAEYSGFHFLRITDDLRLHAAGLDRPGSPWPAVGAIALTTTSLELQIDCVPVFGAHKPVALAHLTQSAAALLPGRFALGVAPGSVRVVSGTPFPTRPIRVRVASEAARLIANLLDGRTVDHTDSRLLVRRVSLPGRLTKSVRISFTATKPDDAIVAAGAGLDLVVDPSVDAGEVVAAYRSAGATGSVSAAVVISDPGDTLSIGHARRLLIDRTVIDELPTGEDLEATIQAAVADLEVEPVTAGSPTDVTAAIDKLHAAGVDDVELLMVGDPVRVLEHLASSGHARPMPAESAPLEPFELRDAAVDGSADTDALFAGAFPTLVDDKEHSLDQDDPLRTLLRPEPSDEPDPEPVGEDLDLRRAFEVAFRNDDA